jgi:hypothetical protein
MTTIETIRTKVRNLNGVKFTLADIGVKNGDLEYFRLRDLVRNKEVIVEGTSKHAVYQATPELKQVKVKQKKTKGRLTIPEKKEFDKEILIGWKSVIPSLFKAPSKGKIYSIY